MDNKQYYNEIKTLKDKMPIVQVKQGKVNGVSCKSSNVDYFAFKGIPYAKPPLGLLRFKAPEPPESWQGVRDASHHGPVCPQYNERLDRIETGSEDCLYLNVYSKSLTPEDPLPVLVWIHGGGFYTGSGNSDFYGPEFFMAHDVILVTFNYRLEVLGFLCLDNEDVPGNAGMKDQVAALKWVKSNISAFGGDSNNITIFGCSAGAASVSYHLISKMSKGLFHKAICQSGVCLNEWSYNIYPKQRAFQLGKLLGNETDNEQKLVEFLKNVHSSLLVNITLPKLDVELRDLADNIFFGPVIEKRHLQVEKFIDESPQDLIKLGYSANVPIILGYTSGEGIETARKLSNILEFLSQVGAVVPREIKLKVNNAELKEIDANIRQYYFGSKDITNKMLQDVVDLHTYSLFAYNIYRFARNHSITNSEPVYMYKFTAESERNYTKKHYRMNNVKGVCHADELPYMFHITSLDIPLSEESMRIIKKFVGLWSTFARTGNPTSSCHNNPWKPYTINEKNVYVIGKTFECVKNPDEEHLNFWEERYKNLLRNHL